MLIIRLLKFHLIPIRDWNLNQDEKSKLEVKKLKFHLIPIRDWNKNQSELIKNVDMNQVEISLNPY